MKKSKAKNIFIIGLVVIILALTLGHKTIGDGDRSIFEKKVAIDSNPTSIKITVTGKSVCLPHKDTTGPQTMECAFGVQDNNGIYYALDTANVPMEDVAHAQTASIMVVTGLMVPVEALSTDHWQKYNIKGIISVSKIDALEPM